MKPGFLPLASLECPSLRDPLSVCSVFTHQKWIRRTPPPHTTPWTHGDKIPKLVSTVNSKGTTALFIFEFLLAECGHFYFYLLNKRHVKVFNECTHELGAGL